MQVDGFISSSRPSSPSNFLEGQSQLDHQYALCSIFSTCTSRCPRPPLPYFFPDQFSFLFCQFSDWSSAHLWLMVSDMLRQFLAVTFPISVQGPSCILSASPSVNSTAFAKRISTQTFGLQLLSIFIPFSFTSTIYFH